MVYQQLVDISYKNTLYSNRLNPLALLDYPIGFW
jgi:hypothetical protein